MQGKIILKIYNIEHFIYCDSVKTIFTDEKNRNYENYDDIKTDILKLVNLTKKVIKGNQQFSIYVKLDNFTVASYESYVSKIDRHLTKGYSQEYKDWETVLNIIEKYGTKPKQKSNIKVDEIKLENDKIYRLQKFNDFVVENLGKSFKLENSVTNNWNGEIEGFEFKKDGTILINCYWQNDSTDGNKYVEYNGNPIGFVISKQDKYGNIQTERFNFTIEQINEAILRLLLENCIIK